MSLRTSFGVFAGRTTYQALHLFGRAGTSLPGKVAATISPDVLSEFSDKFETVIVTGTNGKTLTTALIANVLEQTGRQIITNPSGSNQIQGIISSLLTTEIDEKRNPIAVFEVDEANVEQVAKTLKPKTIVITNIFRDQLDRFGEIYSILEMINNGVKNGDPQATVIVNGDSPIFARADFKNPRKYFGFAVDPNDNQPHKDRDMRAANNTDGVLSPTDDTVLHYHFITYANQGDYFGQFDSFSRPELTTKIQSVDQLTVDNSTFTVDGFQFLIPVGGVYNIYNALAAIAVGQHYNVPIGHIKTALDNQKHIFGRQETFKVGSKNVTIVLTKNPVGTNSVIETLKLEKQAFSLIVLLNANPADGIDTSWIWDAEFENLADTNLQAIGVSGERYKDIDVRMTMAGFEHQVEPDLNKVLDLIKNQPTDKVYIAANYTAMLQLREKLVAAKLLTESF